MNNNNDPLRDLLIALAAVTGKGLGYVIKTVLMLIFALILLWGMTQVLPHIFSPEPNWYNWSHLPTDSAAWHDWRH
jgi:TRAP-type mannitol/chloroaromatic compound transport system permease small subunit